MMTRKERRGTGSLSINSFFLQILLYAGILVSLSSSSHLSTAYKDKATNTNELKFLNNTESEGSIPPKPSIAIPVKNEDVQKQDIGIPFVRKEPVLSAKCDSQLMSVFGAFGDKFKGRIYAYDYPDELDCGVTAAPAPSQNITLHLPLGQCGIQMTTLNDSLESQLRHEVTLYIQYSSFLQQIIDEKVTVSCVEAQISIDDDKLGDNGLVDSSEEAVSGKRNSRQGRRLKNLARNLGVPKSTTKIGEALMEIISGKDPSPKSKVNQPVAVGEDVTLIISTKVQRGYDARVVNCTTHDGSRHTSSDGSRVQPILDSAGCSVDRGLVPNFRRRRLPVESRNRLITLHFASFAAFKFPERDHLHIKCSVAYCQGPCPQESCESGINHYGSWRDKYGRIADVLVETSQVVNAIEVLSPQLDSHNSHGGPGGPDGGGHGQYEAHHQQQRHQSNMPVGTATAAAAAAASPLSLSYSENAYHAPLSSPPNYHPYNAPPPGHSGHGGPGSSIYGNNPIPQPTTKTNDGNSNANNNNNICISPGTVILALVILGVVLVISVTATLWFALKRFEAKKYAQKNTIGYNNPGPAPYYRFNHW